jgi:hypothetical protein
MLGNGNPMKHYSSKPVVLFLTFALLATFQLACDKNKDNVAAVKIVARIQAWHFSVSTDEMGSGEDLQAEYSMLLIHGTKIYFLDQPHLRFNALNTVDGKITWGRKGNARFGKYGVAVEGAAFLSGRIVALSQFGILFVDSALQATTFEEFPRKYIELQYIDSSTDSDIVSISSFNETVEPGTGQRFYARYLTIDRSLKSSDSIEFLGATTHLDAPNPVLVDSFYWRTRRDRENKMAGQPFAVRVVLPDTCIDTGTQLLAIPKQFDVSTIIHSFAFNDSTIAFWTLDEPNRRYTITVLKYAPN